MRISLCPCVVICLGRYMSMLRGIVTVGVLGLLGVAAMLLVTGVGRLDRFDVDVEVCEEILLEVIPLHVASRHELVRDSAGVPDNQRHRASGGNPQRFGRERVLVQRDLDS